MRFSKFVLFFVLTILLQGSIHAQDWVSYQSQQQVNDLVDTGDELLLATDAGLVVMNKSTLEKTIFNKANSNLSNNHIPTITRATNGDIWIGTYDVILQRFDGTDFQDITVPEGVDYNPLVTDLYDLKIAPNGDFWLGTTSGVFRKQGQVWSLYDEAELGPTFFEAWDIEINEEGEVFVASFDVHKFADGIWSNLTETTEINGYLGADLFFSTSGDLYLAGDLDKIGRFDGVQWVGYEHGLNGSHITRLTEDMDGNIYFNAQYDGVYQLTNGNWIQQIDAQTEAFANNISYFYIDAQNNRWLNSNIYLSVNTNGNIQSTSISQHTIAYDNINNLHKGENGLMYFITTSDDNLSVLGPDGNWNLLSMPTSSMPFENFEDILVLADDDIWLASNNGLHHYDGTEWTFDQREACKSFAIDTQGKIYVRASSRIYIIDNGVISEYNTSNSPLTGLYIAGHGVDTNDNLWIAESEINVIQKVSSAGVWTTYTGDDHPAIDDPKGDFHFDVNGNVWVPANLVGAIKFDGTTFSNPFIGNLDLFDNYNAFSIESDATGKVYFAHQYGVTTLWNDEWEDLLIEDVPNTNSSHESKITFDDDGTLWWASSRYGVFSYAPESTTSILSNFEENIAFSVYPNPAQQYTTLDFTTEAKADVNVLIYNYLGQLQSSLDLGQLPAGTFQQTIDLAHFPKGFYSIQVQINDQSSTKTMMVY